MRFAKNWIAVALLLAACSPSATGPATVVVVPPTAALSAGESPTRPAAPGPTAILEPTAVPPTAAPTQTLPPTQVQPTFPPAPSATPTAVAAALLTGNFKDMEVPASGSYTMDPANNVLHLNGDFGVRDGPDLFVVLSGASDLSLSWPNFSSSVSASPILYLGKLISTSGGQSYLIPAGTGLLVYRSVVIWCRQFSAAFAAAPLNP